MRYLRFFMFLTALALAACRTPVAYEPAPVPEPTPPPSPYPAPGPAYPPNYPRFALPAPRPSAKMDLAFTRLGPSITKVGQAEAALRRQLSQAGYDQRSYFAVPGGFALVTQPERFNADGRPAAEPRRWVLEPSALIDWSQLANPASWLSAFRNADPGRYRVIVFLVTTTSSTSGSGQVSLPEAQNWLHRGADVLPPAIAGVTIGPTHHFSVLIYEFARPSVRSDPAFVTTSALGARRHLRGARLAGEGQ